MKFIIPSIFHSLPTPATNPNMRLIPLTFLLSLTSCLPSTSLTLLDRLQNSGIHPLSDKNPGVSANRALGETIQSSTDLQNFFQHRNYPDAIEVRRSVLSDKKLYFYYVSDQEGYLAEENFGQWTIRGPETIPPETFSMLRSLVVHPGGKYDLDIQKKAAPSARPGSSSQEEKLPQKKQEIVKPNPLFHIVTYPGETLRMIADWYCNDSSKAKELALLNKLEHPDFLKIDQQIKIPSGYLKTRELMPRSFVAEYIEKSAKRR
jgi:hypothetical protein